jgi:mono/diheme cytochrome c family protein
VLHALASAIVKERQPTKVDVLLMLAAGQRADQAWRRRSLLDGIAANLRVRPARPIAFNGEPAGFKTLAKSDDASTRQQAEQIKVLFSWPGHQAEEEAPKSAESRFLTSTEASRVAEGENLFQQLCAGCHGLAGQGIVPMGPPLANSEWVTGSERRLIRIALQGLAGPINVNGTVYQPPNILPEMPALAGLDDVQLASVLSYVRRAWGHEAAPISPAQVATARVETVEQERPWTAAQLLEIE